MRVAEYDTLEYPEEAERSGKGWTSSSESISALLLISDAWAERASRERRTAVTALISPRSVKSCANIEWSITQTNDGRGRLSLSQTLARQ